MELTPRIQFIPAPQAFYTGPQAPNVFLVADGGEGLYFCGDHRATLPALRRALLPEAGR